MHGNFEREGELAGCLESAGFGRSAYGDEDRQPQPNGKNACELGCLGKSVGRSQASATSVCVLCPSRLFQHAAKHCAFSESGLLCIVPPTTTNLGKSEEVARCTAGRAGEAGRPRACERVGKSAAAPAVRSPSAEVEKRRRCASKVIWNLTQKSVSYFRDVHLFNDASSRGSFYVYIRSTRSPEQLAVHYASCTEI